MEKQNDYFLNLLSNPTFSASDFTQVGLSIDNTSIQDKDVYLNSDYIRNLDIFQTNGSFDESKLNNFYDYAKQGIVDLAQIKEIDDLGKTWKAYRNDISMPESLRDNSPQFEIQKVSNPLRQQEGFVTFGLKEDPTQSIREIAQTQHTFDPETNTWEESPNETPFSNFLNPKVLATWDEDGTHKDPITGETVEHKKGDKKLNANGTYYYENLGNRSVYGKEVLSAFDTLTTDGSFMNKLDFLDSDDLEKSFGGSLMRAAAQIVPAFIPGVNTWYIGSRVILGMSQILPAVGKTFESLTGTNLGTPLFNYIEALDKTLSFSQSDYTQGSSMDSGEILSDSHLWSWETGLKLVADVFTQLAEQRWMFEKATSAFSGLDKKVIYDNEARTKWIEDYIAKNSKPKDLQDILLKGLSKGVSPEATASTARNLQWLQAQKALETKLKGAQELGSKISLAYMTGITTASSYGEAKEQGASDFEAALFTLGYTFAEWKLLNSDLGKWILPELKSEERHIKNVISTAMPKIKEAGKVANTNTELGKLKWYQKLINIGKDAYHNNLGQGIANETIGSTVSNMASEALEETSEELLLDLSKTLFNIGTDLFGSDTKFNDVFENVFDRYALSFLGGAVGGGIAGTLPSYRAAKLDRSMSQEAATKELVDFIQQGKEKQLIETVDKMTFGNKYMDEQGNQTEDYSKSQDFMIKQNFRRLVSDIKDILTVNGADLSKDSIVKQLSLEGVGQKDLRYGIFSTLAAQKSNAIQWYLNRYNELSSKLVQDSLELKKLEEVKTDTQKRQEESEEEKSKVKLLKDEIEKTKKELDKFKDGTMSDEFILDALFEMSSAISGEFVPSDPDRWILEQTGKTKEELNDAERQEWEQKFIDSKPLRRDLLRMARQVHIKNMEWLAEALKNYNEEYFQNKEGAIKNLEEVLLAHQVNVIDNVEQAVPIIENYLAIDDRKINPLLYNFQQAILASLDEAQSKIFLDKIQKISGLTTDLGTELGITIPQTLEELNSLDETTKKKLFTALGYDNVNDLEAIINSFITEQDNEDGTKTKVLDSKKFNQEISNWKKFAQENKALEFNTQFIEFLQDENIKKEIIKRLSSAKYILPSVKQALTDFFTTTIQGNVLDENGEPIISMETGDPELVSLRQNLVNEYLESFKDKPSSPVDIYLNNVVKTLKSKGINISPLVSNMEELVSKLAKARSLDSFSYTDDVERTIDQALEIIELAKVGLKSAATTINGDLSDAFGFNVSVNEIREKRKSKNPKLATIPNDIATGILLDIEKYEAALRRFKTVQAYNNNQALKEHDKTFKRQNINLFNKIKSFVGHLEAGDWKDINELKQVVESSKFQELLEDEDISPEYKEKITEARRELDNAIYKFFQANQDVFNIKTEEDRKNSIQKIQQLIKALNFDFNYTNSYNTVINSEEKSLPDKDLLWYFASKAAVNPDLVMKTYSEVISSQFAPVIGQEEAIITATSFLANPKIFKLFAEAYNENIKEKARLDPTNFGKKAAYLFINAYRSIFIEGLPGAGKSTAVLKTITDIIDKVNPNILKKVVLVSNSKENAKTLSNNLAFGSSTEVKVFGIEDFKQKVINNYKVFDVDQEGVLRVKQSDLKSNAEGTAWEYANMTPNSDIFDDTLLIIDEATSLSQMDAIIMDKLMESKGIYGLYAGDFDQIGLQGRIEENGVLISQDATNYISTHKLGQVIRGNNTYKSDNIVKFKIASSQFAESLRQRGKIVPLSFSYYVDDSGVYGDIVAKADKKTTGSGNVYDLDQNTKDIIDKMISTLNDGEKINYIYDDQDSELYKYLMSKYSDKINSVAAKAAQSQEGQYYIVDINITDNLENNDSGYLKSVNQFKTLYTSISRAKQATLIYDRGKNNDVISNRISSLRQKNLVKSNLGQNAREKYFKERVATINKVYQGVNEKLKFDWNSENISKPSNIPPIKGTDPRNDKDVAEEESTDSKTDSRNEPKEPNIINDSENSLNMMIHSFNTHEIGGIINKNGELELSEGHQFRTDNAHGIIKALKLKIITDPNTGIQKLSKTDTDNIIKILHEIRRAGLYETTPENIKASIKKALGLPSGQKIEANFIYKNRQGTQINPQNIKGTIWKFMKSVKDKLINLFRKNGDPKLQDPLTHSIGLEIFINGQQIEVPIGTFTSPATLVYTNGFQQLLDIYENNAHKDLRQFYNILKQEKQKGTIIPHLNSMLKLLEIYMWNYNHNTPQQNFVVRFDENFVLNSENKLTGVQTPPKIRGSRYVDQAYFYEGERLSIDDYRKRMPNRKISDIYENLNEDIKDSEGNVVLEHGIPFILVSDYYDSKINDKILYQEYIKQIKEGLPPKITRVYVYLPTESIDYFLYNQQEALTQDEEKSASDVDNSIGNKLTSYRLLQFMLQDDSNFSKEFIDNYIGQGKGDRISFTEDQKKLSIQRFEKLRKIVKYISDYENSLIEDYASGSKSKQILNFLNMTPEAIKSSHKDLYDMFWGKVNIGNTQWTMRTILQYEFRKLLFTGMYYEDENSSPSLNGQDFQITKGKDGSYVYKDFQLGRINALKQDIQKNNWNGVMFHSSLEKESEIVTNYGSESYKVARINAQGASFISSKPIEVNGKLDSTAVIRDVESMLDEILSKVVVKSGTSFVTSSQTTGLSQTVLEDIYKENTGGFLSGTQRINQQNDPKEKYITNIINKLEDQDTNIITKIRKYIDKNGYNFSELELLRKVFPLNSIKNNGHIVIQTNGKYKIYLKESQQTPLIYEDNEFYYEKNGRIFQITTGLEIVDVDTLKQLLLKANSSNALDIINKRISELTTVQDDFNKEQTILDLDKIQEAIQNSPDFFNEYYDPDLKKYDVRKCLVKYFSFEIAKNGNKINKKFRIVKINEQEDLVNQLNQLLTIVDTILATPNISNIQQKENLENIQKILKELVSGNLDKLNEEINLLDQVINTQDNNCQNIDLAPYDNSAPF